MEGSCTEEDPLRRFGPYMSGGASLSGGPTTHISTSAKALRHARKHARALRYPVSRVLTSFRRLAQYFRSGAHTLAALKYPRAQP